MGHDQGKTDKEAHNVSDEDDEPEFKEDAVKRRRPLRTEIETLIEPHRHSPEQKPPFKVEELIVMAVICSDVVTLTKPAIFGWIIYTFQYYSTLAVQQYVRYMEDGLFGGRGPLDIVVDDFYEIFNSRGNPLTERWRSGNDGGTIYSIMPEEARRILRERLNPPPGSSSPLLSRPSMSGQSSSSSDCTLSAAKSSRSSCRRAFCFPNLFERVLRLRLRPASSRIEPTPVSDK